MVYLAGPIVGHTKAEANDWRNYVNERLAPGIKGVSPLRAQPKVTGKYKMEYKGDKLHGAATAIAGKNVLDVRKCDLTLVYLPEEQVKEKPSYGTAIEIGIAYTLNKPIIVVTDNKLLSLHPLIHECANWVIDDLDDAIMLTNDLLGVYNEQVSE